MYSNWDLIQNPDLPRLFFIDITIGCPWTFSHGKTYLNAPDAADSQANNKLTTEYDPLFDFNDKGESIPPIINKHSLIILAFESCGAPARQSLWFFDLISIQLHAKDQRISIQEWRANILAQIGRILCSDMADRYDQFNISCGIELGKMAVASNESLLNATGSGVGIDDSNIAASQDTIISNSSTGSFSEPVRKKQRSSRTVTPTYDPQIQVDGNLVMH